MLTYTSYINYAEADNINGYVNVLTRMQLVSFF